VSHMAQGASRGPRVHIAARPQQHHAPQAVHSHESRFGARWLYEPTARKSSAVTGQITRPGADSTGAGAERKWGFDPQSKAELAQGEYNGAREVLARHAHTAHPWGGWPGGVLRTQRTTKPSWICYFEGISWHLRTWGGVQRAPQTPGN
jgi:hypothetical protein